MAIGKLKSRGRLMWSRILEFMTDDGHPDDATDLDDPIAIHVMPTVMVDGFERKVDAEKFIESIDAAGNPAITDANGVIIGHYLGHALSSCCACEPELVEGGCGNNYGGDGGVPTWSHRLLQ